MSVTNKIHSFPTGLTVREFKKIVAEWPEEKEDGTLTEVWIECNGDSNLAHSVWACDVDNKDNADLLIDTEEA